MPSSNIDVYLRLLNARRFQGGLSAASGGVQSFAGSIESASAASSGLAVAANAAGSALYAVGSASRVAGYVVGAALTAGVTAGIKFNATMESNTLAFEHFAGGAKKAQTFVNGLFDIARQTPFGFEDITTAARRLLAFGFNAKETTKLLKTMGDTISYTGGSTDEILRLGKAMGDIRSKGRLMQQEMNQLTNVGINIQDVLKKGGLNLTAYQLKNIGRAGIPANIALKAIQKGLDAVYGGGAQKYLQTFNGQWQRLQDNFAYASGHATTGLFGNLKEQLSGLNDVIEGKKNSPVLDWFNTNGPKAVQIAGVAFSFAKDQVNYFLKEMAPIEPFLNNVIWPLAKGILLGVVGSLKAAIDILHLFALGLGFAGDLAAPFGGAIQFVGAVLAFVFGGEVLKAISLLTKFGGVFRLIGGLASLLYVPIRLVGGAFEFLSGVIFRALNPGAISRLVGEIVTVFNGAVPKFLQIGSKLADAIVMGLATLTKKIGSGFLRGFLFAALNAKEFINFILGSLNHALPNSINIPHGPDIPLPDNPFPLLWRGGTVANGGAAIVGDRGPEMLENRGGRAVVTPLTGRRSRAKGSSINRDGAAFTSPGITLNAPIYLDRKLVGHAMGEYAADIKARA